MRLPIVPHRFFIGIDRNQAATAPPGARLFDRNAGRRRRSEMLDTVMVVAGVAFFVLAVAYVAACDRM